MYASAGIAEVWLVDVAGAAIEVHTQPTADGYAHTERFAGAQHLPIAALACASDPAVPLVAASFVGSATRARPSGSAGRPPG